MTERRRLRKSTGGGVPLARQTVDTPDVVDAAGNDDSIHIASVRRALDRRMGTLRFEPPLERRFQHDIAPGRTARIAGCNAVAAALYWFNTTNDADVMPALAALMSPLRLWTVAFILVAAALMYWRRHTAPAWAVDVTTVGGALISTVYVLIAAHNPPADLSVLIRMGGLFLIFLHAGLAARLQFRSVLSLNSLIFVGYALCARSDNAQQAMVVAGNLRLLATAFAFTSVANYVLEFRERRAYLMKALHAHHQQTLIATSDALRHLSLNDGLTGLANRRHFDAELRAAWARAAKCSKPLAVLQIDVDFFKRYNDGHGHPAGDVCLQNVAEVLRRIAARQSGLAARVGGEEFVLLLPGCSLAAAAEVGETVLAGVRALAIAHTASSCASCVTVSIGVAATLPPAASGPFAGPALLRAADAALYAAKQAGRNRLATAPAPHHAAPVAACTAAPGEAAADVQVGNDNTLGAQLADRINALTAALSQGLHWLRFPAALEAHFMATSQPRRGLFLCVLGIGGTLYAFAYVLLSRPLLSDVSDLIMPIELMLGAIGLPLMLWLLRPMVPWKREAIFSTQVMVTSIGASLFVASSQVITVYSYALSLFLVSMFSAVIVAQPFRFSLVNSVLTWVLFAVSLSPKNPALRTAWIETSFLLLNGSVLSLIGGYLIDLSARRNYLLGQLAEAQSELLTDTARRLRHLAEEDPLTGLANRRKFDNEHAAQLTACAATGQPLGLLIVDIDHFKRYNDSLGHPAGDACLRQVAEALGRCVSALAPSATGGHLVARLGGEEFGVLLPGHDRHRALAFAETLCAQVRQTAIAHPDSPVAPHVTVSVGAASTAPGKEADGAALLRDADASLYRAKNLGRDRAAD